MIVLRLTHRWAGRKVKGPVRELAGKNCTIGGTASQLGVIRLPFASKFAGMMAMSKSTLDLASDAARAGAGIGMTLGMGFLAAVWFFPTMGAALLGFLMKKNSIVEVGPLGL
jgi:hypothetical protein